MARTEFYNRAGVTVTIDGTIGTDLGEEMAFKVTMPDNMAELTKGVDKSSMNFNSDKTCEVEIAFKASSPLNEIFYNIYHDQINGNARLFNTVANSGNNETLTFNGCGVKGIEGIEGGGEKASVRIVKLSVVEFQPDKALMGGQ